MASRTSLELLQNSSIHLVFLPCPVLFPEVRADGAAPAEKQQKLGKNVLRRARPKETMKVPFQSLR